MKLQHETFALAIARGKDPVTAYKEVYPRTKDDEAARVSAARLMKREDIATLIATQKKEIVTIATKAAIEEVKEDRKFQVLSFLTKREILFKIAVGKKIATTDKDGNKVYRYPSEADRIKAIELDNEMTGEGFRPPEPPAGGSTTINGPVYNTVIRKTVFKTRETTAGGQTFQITPNE